MQFGEFENGKPFKGNRGLMDFTNFDNVAHSLEKIR